ncbi:MAG: tetratricopeptide repeat protein, partial [Thermoplasmata archaeon]|nr:tetratricopeptide repeat protein [Thermoplasmata archaeon]NIS18856.1 tetratricopeptide repeat protein [Thermoplasmata archaeon]NIU48011.1 tetratricopeptide repeat protein [Thermoplasmata archaeon]NIV77663.1 tetratricopeptide repeat protein [Thermoplasmata archaeon]NIW81499.1 tetratricopeptide repeat protein [Thermoplasmata archaeon]
MGKKMGFRRGGRVLDKAKAMRSRGQHDKAIRYLEDAMERERRRRNPEPLMMAAYQNEKACILYRAGSTERAAEEIQECLDLIDKGGIDNDEFHAKVLRNQGVFLRELGRFKEARRSLRTARWIDDRRGPEGAYDSANDHYQLGLVLSGLNRHGEALAVFEETLTMYSDLSRGPTKEMGLTLNNIALQLYS